MAAPDPRIEPALLNRGKRVVAADLKHPDDAARVRDLARGADVIIEQFRPGVADRLGIGYDDVRAVNQGVVYCSITGYGQHGPRAGQAGHDLNFLAESGLLSLVTAPDGTPSMPFTVLADIAGGAYPAVLNILLALRLREATGTGERLDIPMADNLQTLAYRYLAKWEAQAAAGGGTSPAPPAPNGEQLTGGTARYRVYRTADDRFVAVGAVEDHFWRRLAKLIGLDETYADDRSPGNIAEPERVIAATARCFARRTAAQWAAVFDGEDVCATIVATFDQAVRAGTLLADRRHRVVAGGHEIPALPVPLSAPVRGAGEALSSAPLMDIDETVTW
ncbi:MAG TPA: CaiB/BaiF CoA-transferase family protein [Trebonia sp.]